MFIDEALYIKTKILNDTAEKYEASVQTFPAKNYLGEFYDFYEIKNRNQHPVIYKKSFPEALKEVCGDDAYQPLADKTKSLFGAPNRVLLFEDSGRLTDEMSNADSAAPFYIVFDFMFCEYKDFTLLFISGTNN